MVKACELDYLKNKTRNFYRRYENLELPESKMSWGRTYRDVVESLNVLQRSIVKGVLGKGKRSHETVV